MTGAWNSFLLASASGYDRKNDNPEIRVMRSASGDFMCMEHIISEDRNDHFADMFTKCLDKIVRRFSWSGEQSVGVVVFRNLV
jgi:hypothetical protein